jgi:hypothetical protein
VFFGQKIPFFLIKIRGKLWEFRVLKRKLNNFAKFLQKHVKFLFHKIGREKETVAAYRIGP